MKKVINFIAVAACVVAPGIAAAETITFDGFSHGQIVDRANNNTFVHPLVTVSALIGDGSQDCLSFGRFCPMVFDSSISRADFLGEDTDLLGPFTDPTNPGAPSLDAGNILIVSEDNDTTDPDDYGPAPGLSAIERRASLVFNFAEAITFNSVDVIDINEDPDEVELLTITFLGANQVELGQIIVRTLVGDNEYTTVTQADVEGVSTGVLQIRFDFFGSGAIDNLNFDVVPTPLPAAIPLMAMGLAGVAWGRRRQHSL